LEKVDLENKKEKRDSGILDNILSVGE